MATQNQKTQSKAKSKAKELTKVDRAVALLARKGGAYVVDLAKAFKEDPAKARSVIGAIRAAGGKVEALGGGKFVLRKKPT